MLYEELVPHTFESDTFSNSTPLCHLLIHFMQGLPLPCVTTLGMRIRIEEFNGYIQAQSMSTLITQLDAVAT